MAAVYGQYLQAICRFSLDSHRAQVNILNFVLPTAGDFTAAAAAVGTAIGNSWQANLETPLSTLYEFEEIEITDMRSAVGGQVVATIGETGDNSTNALPAGVALVGTLRTALRGRSYRGRCYIGGWTESDNSATGNPATAAGDAVVAYLDDIRTDLSATAFDLAVVSKYSGTDGSGNPIPRSVAVVTPVTTITSDNVWDRQKRRGLAP